MKRYTVVFTPRAERQLDRLYSFIAGQSGTARAEHFVGALMADCLSLSTFPESGARRDDIRLNMRVKGFRRRVSIAFSIDAASAPVAIHVCSTAGRNSSSCSATR
jgi:plasmid stabilization system protein ParE